MMFQSVKTESVELEVIFVSHDGSKMSDYDKHKVIFVHINIPIWPY